MDRVLYLADDLRLALSAAIVMWVVFLAACSDGSDGKVNESAASRNLATTVQQLEELPGYNIYRPVNLLATGAALPVVVWTSGGCVRWDETWKILLDRWASAGFITIAPTAPAGGDPRTAGLTTVDDQAGVIDWAHAENERNDSPFKGRMDLDRIVAAGNSCGGIVSLTLAAMDDRVHSVFVLSGSSTAPGAPTEAAASIMGNVLVPVGYVVGGPEDIAREFARQDYALLPVGVPAFVAMRFEGDHRTVSTDTGILSQVAEIGTHWIDFTLNGNSDARQALLANPCGDCAPDTWILEAKNLDLHVVE